MKRITTFNDKDNTCTVTRTCKKHATDPVGTMVIWQFDLKSFTNEEIRTHAIRSLVIDAQRLWRDGKIPDDCKINHATFDTERKSPQPSAKGAKGYIVNELAKGRDIDDIMTELKPD